MGAQLSLQAYRAKALAFITRIPSVAIPWAVSRLVMRSRSPTVLGAFCVAEVKDGF